jgi:hypothetical protein
VALIFTVLGIYSGLRWTRASQVVVIREVPVRMDGLFVLDAVKLKEVGLTAREHEILALIAQGISNRVAGGQQVRERLLLLVDDHERNKAQPPAAECPAQ